MKKRIVVAMSGGIDSSVAALLLKQQHKYDEIIGVFMRNWDVSDEHTGEVAHRYDGSNRYCASVSDDECVSANARSSVTAGVCTHDLDRLHMQQVCERLQIPHYEVNFVKEYWSSVFEPFVDGCQSGTSKCLCVLHVCCGFSSDLYLFV
jgi:tRNA U34 2-thiouridine synthase MnmA/TrmU